jgi:hypothetical protein
LPGVHAAVVDSARFTYFSGFGGQLFLSLLLRFPGSCSATPEWAITPRGDGNHLGFFLATFDVAINVVRVSPLLLKGACSLPEPALVGAALARSLGEIAMMDAGANSSISAWGEGNDSLSANPKLLWAVSDVGVVSTPRVSATQDTGWLTEDG